MIKRISDFLAGLPATIAAGVFLLMDLIPHLATEFGITEVPWIAFPFDPGWVTVLISGTPLVYLAVWRMIHHSGIGKISSALLISIAMFAAIAIGDLFAVTLSVLGVLTPTTGALVHNVGSCFVVLIAALLYDRKFE